MVVIQIPSILRTKHSLFLFSENKMKWLLKYYRYVTPVRSNSWLKNIAMPKITPFPLEHAGTMIDLPIRSLIRWEFVYLFMYCTWLEIWGWFLRPTHLYPIRILCKAAVLAPKFQIECSNMCELWYTYLHSDQISVHAPEISYPSSRHADGDPLAPQWQTSIKHSSVLQLGFHRVQHATSPNGTQS